MKPDQLQEALESLLKAADWSIQNPVECDLKKSLGVAVRNFPLARAYGKIDYLLFLEGKAAGLIEMTAMDRVLSGVPTDSEKYSRGLPFSLRLFTRPLPFLYQSKGFESCFTNTFDPHPRLRPLMGFHRPETLLRWIEDGMVGETPRDMAAEHFPEHRRRGRSFQERVMINMPKLEMNGLSPRQHQAIKNVETSLSKNHMRVLVKMESRAEHTMLTLRMIERLLKFADARRVLVLFDAADIAQRFEKKLQAHRIDNERTLFTEAFPLQHLNNALTPESRLCITTFAKLHSLLNDRDPSGKKQDKPSASRIRYNPALPIESFEVLILTSCDTPISHDSHGILQYFDAYLIGMTDKTSQEVATFFEQNSAMQYREAEPEFSVRPDGLNVISS